jgi:DNA topoisomerase-3
VEVAQGARLNMVREILAEAGRRPAIVYTPTRREAESFARALRAEPYHAGMDPKRRDEVQAAFLGEQIDTIVATIAFGMGIDKPNVRTVVHTGLPGSLEGYYQEIGRAGRDGAPSRAILMQAYSDRRTHDYFFERDYPDPAVLAAIFNVLKEAPQERDVVMQATHMDEESFDAALDKLSVHGGAHVDAGGCITRGAEGWRESYEQQCERKQAQLRDMLRFTECNQCRMVKLVRHFGDLAGARKPCGICDYCAGEETIAQKFRPAWGDEQALAREVIHALRAVGTTSSGRLFKQLGDGVERYTFERMLAGLARAGFIEMTDAVFETEGREIPYKRLSVTPKGRALDQESPVEFEVTEGVAAPPKPRKKKRRKTKRG